MWKVPGAFQRGTFCSGRRQTCVAWGCLGSAWESCYNPHRPMTARTLYQKIWDAHLVYEAPGQPALLYIDRHLVHEGTSPQAFSGLRAAGRKVRRPDLTFAVMDHSVPMQNRELPILDAQVAAQFDALSTNCRETGVRLFDMNS